MKAIKKSRHCRVTILQLALINDLERNKGEVKNRLFLATGAPHPRIKYRVRV